MVANKNTGNEIVVAVKSDPAVIETLRRQNEIIALKMEVFQLGVHYGPPYKGAKNDTLLKPGATFLQNKFQLHEHHERLETTVHVNVDDLSKSYIIIQNRCRIFNADGAEVAQADAACTTFEDKYLFRGGGDRTCPTCSETKIIKSKFDKGWYCLACKAKFAEDDALIVNQDTTKKLNPNPLNLLDTIVAMAQKRASVRATIKATGVDAIFSPGDGVTVDYYDDLDQSNAELITVVSQNASESHQDGESRAQAAGDYEPQGRTPQQALNGNGPAERTVAPKSNGKAGYKEADLWNAVLRPVYGNEPIKMKKGLKALNEEGVINPFMSLDEAIEAVKSAEAKKAVQS